MDSTITTGLEWDGKLGWKKQRNGKSGYNVIKRDGIVRNWMFSLYNWEKRQGSSHYSSYIVLGVSASVIRQQSEVKGIVYVENPKEATKTFWK